MSVDQASYPDDYLAEARAALSMSTDALFEDLCAERRGTLAERVAAGRQRYAEIVAKYREIICKANGTVHRVFRDHHVDHAAHLVCAIADTLIHERIGPVPAITIAALLVQEGVENWCKPYWHVG
jgi:hypothetical protein